MIRIHQLLIFSGLLAALTSLSACQTTPDSDSAAVQPEAQIPFTPRIARATIQAAESARYPNLFTGASHADWGGEQPPVGMPSVPAPAPSGEEAAPNLESVETPADPDYAVRASGLTITCRLESEFPDRSIAYDAVGLRGMEVFLLLPSGETIAPAQKLLHSDLEEVPVGALRRYGRKLTLFFSERQYLVENPAVNPAAEGVRLVVRGGGSEFFFHWPATPDFASVPEPRMDKQVVETTRNYFRTGREAVSRASHTLD